MLSGTCDFSNAYFILLSGSRSGGVSLSKKQEPAGARDKVKRAAERLRELEASGVELSEILGGPAGAQFVCRDCEGDPDLAYAAFALAHSSKSQRAY
jgi:hypothetical protein